MNKASKVFVVEVGTYEITISAPTRSAAKWRACAALANRAQSREAVGTLAVYYILRCDPYVKRLPHLDGWTFDPPVIRRMDPDA